MQGVVQTLLCSVYDVVLVCATNKEIILWVRLQFALVVKKMSDNKI